MYVGLCEDIKFELSIPLYFQMSEPHVYGVLLLYVVRVYSSVVHMFLRILRFTFTCPLGDVPAFRLSGAAALQTAQIVLGEDSPEWGSSNIMPSPTGDIFRYRGRLELETANFIKTSRCSTKYTSDKAFMLETTRARKTPPGFAPPLV